MQILVKILIVLAALTFLMGGIQVIFPVSPIMDIYPESFSRASSNLALIAIALSVCCKSCSKSS